MHIAVIGLGIIGASIARSLTVTGNHVVDGWNRTSSVTQFAMENGYISGEVKNVSEYDVVFIALPPDKTMEYLDKTTFRTGAVVSDICGIKKPVEEVVYSKQRNFYYVGSHPMAGKATTGILSSSEKLFNRANIVICENENTNAKAEEIVKQLYKEMGAGRIICCSAEFHDQKIAYTSQLAHIVSNGYIKSKTAKDCIAFTGGSFQDMTRVAPLDENVWTRLFSYNRKNLIDELDSLIDRLQEYQKALKDDDEEQMKKLLIAGKQAHFDCYNKK